MLLKVKVYDSPSQENMKNELSKKKMVNYSQWKVIKNCNKLWKLWCIDALMHLSHQLVDHDYEICIYIIILQGL